MQKDIARKNLGGGIFRLVGDDSFTESLFEFFKSRIIGIHADRVIVAVEPLAENELENFEVADHFAIIEGVTFKDTFDFTRVSMGKAALVGMLAQHVTVFDFKDSADAIGHEISGD